MSLSNTLDSIIGNLYRARSENNSLESYSNDIKKLDTLSNSSLESIVKECELNMSNCRSIMNINTAIAMNTMEMFECVGSRSIESSSSPNAFMRFIKRIRDAIVNAFHAVINFFKNLGKKFKAKFKNTSKLFDKNFKAKDVDYTDLKSKAMNYKKNGLVIRWYKNFSDKFYLLTTDEFSSKIDNISIEIDGCIDRVDKLEIDGIKYQNIMNIVQSDIKYAIDTIKSNGPQARITDALDKLNEGKSQLDKCSIILKTLNAMTTSGNNTDPLDFKSHDINVDQLQDYTVFAKGTKDSPDLTITNQITSEALEPMIKYIDNNMSRFDPTKVLKNVISHADKELKFITDDFDKKVNELSSMTGLDTALDNLRDVINETMVSCLKVVNDRSIYYQGVSSYSVTLIKYIEDYVTNIKNIKKTIIDNFDVIY